MKKLLALGLSLSTLTSLGSACFAVNDNSNMEKIEQIDKFGQFEEFEQNDGYLDQFPHIAGWMPALDGMIAAGEIDRETEIQATIDLINDLIDAIAAETGMSRDACKDSFINRMTQELQYVEDGEFADFFRDVILEL